MMDRIKQHQELYEKYIDQLGDNYKKLYQQQEDFNQQYHARMTDLKTQLEAIWVSYDQPPSTFHFPNPLSPPPPSTFDQPLISSPPPPPPFG